MKSADGSCKGIGWITFGTQAAMQEAISWNGCPYGGRHLQITPGKAMHTGIRPSLQAAGTHTPAMLSEVTANLVSPRPSGTVIDATFGRGGHTRGMLAALSPRGAVHAFDMDGDAITVGRRPAPGRSSTICPPHRPLPGALPGLRAESRVPRARRPGP